ncbi:helix-turn-helix domain-containing protein [Variovorax sp. dw_308]|uniref:helix-turn-helix domain-containing protein n=1 Tax=Variovorax sp. dw_308 TaxID=2721546 RepID=UPI001C467CD1|nr:helix-turn-helix domain-containing protein [Variovorax sp. dw_308]
MNPAMADCARSFVNALQRKTENSLVAETRRAIYLSLPVQLATIKQVAQSPGRSVRSFQRELDASGRSFTDLFNTGRRELVIRYLADTQMDVGQISSLPGHADSPSFIRWFVQQFGSTTPRTPRDR